MVVVLLVLCIVVSLLTISKQYPNGPSAGEDLAEEIFGEFGSDARVVVVTGRTDDDVAFAAAAKEQLQSDGATVVSVVNGSPSDGRDAFEKLESAGGETIDAVACNHGTADWLATVAADYRVARDARIVEPDSYYWPAFLRLSNLRNVANQNVEVAIVAIGMTMLIITGGIDLSVGSLITLSTVVATMLIGTSAVGGYDAGVVGVILCCLAAILVCAALGAFSGTIVLTFRVPPYLVPPFIVTLAMMLIARGFAYTLTKSETISEVPKFFGWLGRGADLFGIPNSVVLMLLLYAVAHIVMSRTTLGRYIYAVGGNAEAARLSGVPVKRVLLIVYTLCAALAGLGGVIMASNLGTGSATYASMYELYVIAAVVVGGTSLAGGEGKILGTLIGVFIIAVIRNGMNLINVSGRTQDLVLGLVILAAVLMDMFNKWLSGRQRKTEFA